MLFHLFRVIWSKNRWPEPRQSQIAQWFPASQKEQNKRRMLSEHDPVRACSWGFSLAFAIQCLLRQMRSLNCCCLLPSRLYCRFWNFTKSWLGLVPSPAHCCARGLYRQSGISPCPEDVRYAVVVSYHNPLPEKKQVFFFGILHGIYLFFLWEVHRQIGNGKTIWQHHWWKNKEKTDGMSKQKRNCRNILWFFACILQKYMIDSCQ